MSKDIPIIFSGPMVRALLDGRKTMTRRLAVTSRWKLLEIGDRLWVRESAAWINNIEFGQPSYWEYRADTDGKCFAGDWPPETKDDPDRPRWKTSIHMPRVASRLTLIVTGVMIHRLNAITEDDAIKEGMAFHDNGLNRWGQQGECWHHDPEQAKLGANFCLGSARLAFGNLWNKLHGEFAWDQNPSVIAISFRVLHFNIDAEGTRAA